MRAKHCCSFLKYLASFPEEPHNLCPDFPPGICGFGGSSPSYRSSYIGTSSARASFSSVSTAGTVCPFSTRERQQRKRPQRFSTSPCENSFISRTVRSLPPNIIYIP